MKRRIKVESVESAGTASASTVDTFDDFPLLQFVFRDPADAVRAEVRVTCLDAAQTADILVPGLLPLGDQSSVRNLFFDAVVIQLFGNGLPLVEQVIDVSCPLVVDLKDRPQGFHTALSLMWITFRFSHLCLQLLQCGLDQLPAIGRRFASGPPDLWHWRR